MGNNILRAGAWAVLIIFCAALVIMFCTPSPVQPEPPKTVLELKMIPVENVPGEFILEYSNGIKELLRADGTRVPLEITE